MHVMLVVLQKLDVTICALAISFRSLAVSFGRQRPDESLQLRKPVAVIFLNSSFERRLSSPQPLNSQESSALLVHA
jgi:hypothetical protein